MAIGMLITKNKSAATSNNETKTVDQIFSHFNMLHEWVKEVVIEENGSLEGLDFFEVERHLRRLPIWESKNRASYT